MRIVIKIGSNLLTTEKGDIDLGFIANLASQIKELSSEGDQVLIVSSGAVLCGVKKLGLEKKPQDLKKRQALSGVGQAYLMHLYDTVFSNYRMTVAQVLLTSDVFKKGNEERFMNAKGTLEELLSMGVVPIINENDAVAVSELIFGDNDFLSVYVSYMIGADLLVILSSAGGLRDERGNIVKEITDTQKAMELVRDEGSEFGSGGMKSKIEATRLALSIGIPVVITGKDDELRKVKNLETKGTVFRPSRKKVRRKISTIAMVEEPKGALIIDEGAVKALKEGKSLLPAGVLDVHGNFKRGDVVSVFGPDKRYVAKGKVNFSSEEIIKIKGLKGRQVKELLNTTKEEVIHRDNLALFQ